MIFVPKLTLFLLSGTLEFLDVSNTNLSGDVPSDICDRESSIQVDIRVDCEEVVCNCCDECNHSNF